jgi:hypothetical protein
VGAQGLEPLDPLIKSYRVPTLLYFP